MKKIQSIRGMSDNLPTTTPVWQYLESTLAELLQSYSYQEIRFPIMEQSALFKRSIGDATDIVEKEMYTFEDRNGDSISLRPEGTASCVRAGEQNGLLYNQVQRLWYCGPMFRHERPQKGRLRQFHQIGVEAFGMASADIDAELLVMTARLWKKLGIYNNVRLELNSIGSAAARAEFKAALVSYLTEFKDQLDEDSQRRLGTNPLRILDSKSAETQAILDGGPVFSDYIDEESAAHFERLKQLLEAAGIEYQLNPRLVRGLDYYSKTVFEWITNDLGAQGTICAGGRYDGLVEQLGGKPTPGVGFAMGLERLVLLLEELDVVPQGVNNDVDAYFVVPNDETYPMALAMAEQLRTAMPTLKLQLHCGGGKFKKQMKKADESGAKVALILDDDAAAQGQLAVKPLRDGSFEQNLLAVADIPAYLGDLLA
ncbi:histidyl-tRNA synthetase [Sinobacterium caligoides]|uniref:Histidine--tRNA ligase n=1 Tax=Sinobacterium caligoides TaxID=933926 RepID=A0A3N2DZ57_9GAMM|nr:histidine--tRNA ligase [Sinobacterium caligoides]ROS05166.1 histidyl-tRNA synthetase [Sinobacterium caligoides]